MFPDDGVHFIWEAADGKSMGSQQIKDKRLNITTQWFNRQNSWSAQIKVARNDSISTSVVFYFALQVGFWALGGIFENVLEVVSLGEVEKFVILNELNNKYFKL